MKQTRKLLKQSPTFFRRLPTLEQRHHIQKNRPLSYHAHYKAQDTLRLYEAAEALLYREQMFRIPNLTAAQIAETLGCNPRALSAAMSHSPHKNFRSLLAATRVEEACRQLRNPELADLRIEDIAINCGFLSRQAFYLAFQNIMGMTPRQYRLEQYAL